MPPLQNRGLQQSLVEARARSVSFNQGSPLPINSRGWTQPNAKSFGSPSESGDSTAFRNQPVTAYGAFTSGSAPGGTRMTLRYSAGNADRSDSHIHIARLFSGYSGKSPLPRVRVPPVQRA